LTDLITRMGHAPAPPSPSAPAVTRPVPLAPLPSSSPRLHPVAEQRRPTIKPSPPADFNGDRSKGKAFLQSCRTYIRLSPDTFDSEVTKIIWAMSYMKSGRAGRWASREFELEATSETHTLRFFDWYDFEDEFRKDFTPLNEEATAVNTLETTTYFQGRRSVDEYLDSFRDLVYDSGYTDPKTIVVKFRRGLDRRLSNALAGMTTGRPSDTDPEAWFRLATQMDQNTAADRAFHASLISPPLTAPPPRMAPSMPPRPAALTSFAHSAPTPGNPVPMDIDATRRAKAIADTCRRCGDTGHWARDCPRQFDIRYLGFDELRAIMDEKFNLENPAPLDSLKDDGYPTLVNTEELPLEEVPSDFAIRSLDRDPHPAPTSFSCPALPEAQVSSRHLSREEVIVRGTSPRPPTRPRLAPRVPAARPVEPPDIPPNLHRPVDPRRW
jgi:hypothetical protein